MNGHIDSWLTAYYDRELSGQRLRQVEEHLAVCERCRAQLDQLVTLSAVLWEAPEPDNLTPSDRFVAQVQLQLPRQSVEPGCAPRASELSWNLVPLGLFGVWGFLQTVFVVSGMLRLALERGWGGEALMRMLHTPIAVPDWVAQINEASQATFRVLTVSPLEGLLPPQLWITMLMGLLASIWLAAWVLRQRRLMDTE